MSGDKNEIIAFYSSLHHENISSWEMSERKSRLKSLTYLPQFVQFDVGLQLPKSNF